MIKRIKVRNIATYDDVGVTIENIEKVNYIYGANGCGKTTISNFLDNMEENQFLDCEVEWENNVSEKVFVYNKTFREKNFKESDIAGIFTLGLFFASTFWTKLQNIFGHYCKSKLDKVAKP